MYKFLKQHKCIICIVILYTISKFSFLFVLYEANIFKTAVQFLVSEEVFPLKAGYNY